MTAIVGLVHEGTVWIGGDSACVHGENTFEGANPKVFVAYGSNIARFLLGYTSSFRMGQLLQYCLSDRLSSLSGSGLAMMVREFVPALRDLFAEHGYECSDESGQKFGGTFLVGHGGALYTISDDYAVIEMAAGYSAVGCGQDYALGSLHSTRFGAYPPERRVTMALEAAAEFSSGVRGPFLVKSLKE